METSREFGDLLFELREGLRLSKRGLAQKCGTHESYILLMERDGLVPSRRALDKIYSGLLHSGAELIECERLMLLARYVPDRLSRAHKFFLHTVLEMGLYRPRLQQSAAAALRKLLERQNSPPG